MASRGGFLVGDTTLRRKNINKKACFATSTSNKPTHKKKKKPEWDSTVHDLNVFKATQEELKRRHEVHKSKNVGLKNISSNKENEIILVDTPDTAMKRKQAILQEILYGNDEFQEVLAENDKTMSAVKDIFGDDPKKYLGFPNVTVAPNITEEATERLKTGPFTEPPETPTHLSNLSDSVMRTPALNEVSNESDISDSSPEEVNNHTKASAFEPRLDLQRYRQFISHEAAENKQDGISEPVVTLHGPREYQMGNIIGNQSNDSTPPSKDPRSFTQKSTIGNVSQQTPVFSTSANHIPSNDRHVDRPKDKVDVSKKPKPKTNPRTKDTSVLSSNSGLRSLEELKKMVESLEDEISQYEVETGRPPTATDLQTNSFGGYTSSLISAVTKLMKYLKETEVQRRAEAVLRDQIIQGFDEQRVLIDALTNDIVRTQEQHVLLQSEFMSYKQKKDLQLDYLQRELHVILNSFEYHTVQSTINILNSTKPVPLPQLYADSVSHGTEGKYIPVSSELGDHSSPKGVFKSSTAPLSHNQATSNDITNTHLHTDKPSNIIPQMENFTLPESPTHPNIESSPLTNLSSPNRVHSNGKQARHGSLFVQPHLDVQSDLNGVPGCSKLMYPSINGVQETPEILEIQGHSTRVQTNIPGIQRKNGSFTNDAVMHTGAGNPQGSQDLYTPSLPHSNQEIQSNTNGFSSNSLIYHGENGEDQDHFSNTTDVQTSTKSFPPNLTHGSNPPAYQKWSGHRVDQEYQTKRLFTNSQVSEIYKDSTAMAHNGVLSSASNATVDYLPVLNGASINSQKPVQSYRPLVCNNNENGINCGSSQSSEGPTLSHKPLQGCKDYLSRSEGVQGIHDSNVQCEDSLLMKSLVKDPQATSQLRQRLHGIAMKQKNSAVFKMAIRDKQNKTEMSTKGQPSPHVHFSLPLEATNSHGNNQKIIAELPEKSPSISPIPEVGTVNTGVKKGRQVVVNLPSVWSDVSSTVSI